jgi:hypothetical protein
MDTYPNTNYRKIYKQHFGPIPIDQHGRSYDIHHIDGNPKNNHISNLLAVSVQEHYKIHYKQNDWLACYMIALRLDISPEIISKLSSDAQLKRLQDGQHHFGSSEWQRNNQLKRVESGNHPFIGGKIQKETSERLISEGKHIFQNLSRTRVENGTHHFLGESNPMHAKVADGTHPWLGNGEAVSIRQKQRVKDGSHVFACNNPNNTKLTCPYCNKTGSKPGMLRYHFSNCKRRSISTQL